MDAIQAELDASAAKVEQAHAAEDELEDRLGEVSREMGDVEKSVQRLTSVAAKRARSLYMEGNTGLVEVLFDGAADFSDISTRAEMLSQVSLEGSDAFVALARARQRMDELTIELETNKEQLEGAQEELEEEAERLQAQLDSVAEEYEKLRAELVAAQPAPPPLAPAPAGGGGPPSIPAAAPLPASGGMFCPVAGPVSFVDSWGAPRSGGRTHEGVDMMGAYGTPQVAIVSGTITYAGYSSLGGNVLYLSGDDGNLYVYVHSATQLSGGRVEAGQQIGTLGDSGNAAGNPHLHFEFHPGGGGPVNPYPLAASVC